MALRIEGADRFQRVAEEIEANRIAARRKQIEDAAADGILTGIGHRAGAGIARRLQALHQACHVDHVAGGQLQARRGEKVARRDTLQHRVHRGQHDQRCFVALFPVGEIGERGNPLGDDLGIGRDPVVRHAVPGGKAQAFHVGREEVQRIFERGEPLAIAGDVQDRRARGPAAGALRQQRDQKGIEAFGHAARDGALGAE